jgi:pimeloyl-ACP methyl ester carboxylesterase
MMLKILAPLWLAVCIAAITFTLNVNRSYGTRIRLDDARRVRILIRGQGTPTVVFEHFGVAPVEAWNVVQPRVSEFTRTFTYDHAGYWGSDPGPTPRDARAIAADLHATLQRANIPPPYILVGQSFGGPLIRVFAHTYPNDVAGLVFVDPTQEEFIAWLRKHHPHLNRIDPKDLAAGNEWGCGDISLAQACAATPLPAVPLTLITAMDDRHVPTQFKSFLPIWLDCHRQWLRQFPRAGHIVLTNSGHPVQFDQPEQVIDAIRDIVHQARNASARERQ